MSTTVSYKGATIATVSNQTKTLLTEGKYLEDDLTLTDVSGGGSTLITKSISENGTYNASSDSADGYSQVNVAVPASAVDTGTKNITANGNGQDVVGYAAVNVNVPNSYSAGDEGKVVSNGALVAQTSDTVTTNDTYDTTLINSLTVNVSGGGGDGVIERGTFTIESDTKNVTLQHDLGEVPDFCIVYPIETPTASAPYRMNFQVLLIGLGQSNYNISTNTNNNFGSPHNMGGGTGYNVGVAGFFGQGTPQAGYAGTATTTTFKVGGINESGSGGTLTAGTYGYILGVLS